MMEPNTDPFAPPPLSPDEAPQEGGTYGEFAQGISASPPTKAALLTANATNLALAGMFIAAVAVLYLLSLRGGPREASAQEKVNEARVDAVLLQLQASQKAGPGHKSATQEIMDRFYHDAQDRQVPLDNLKGNPFYFRTPPRTDLTQAAEDSTKEAFASPPIDIGEADALKRASTLSLQSILSGTHGNVAMISNNLLTTGQSIQGWTVKRIDPKSVLLCRGEQTYVLRMPE